MPRVGDSMQRSSGREWGGGVAILGAMPDPRALRAVLGRAVERLPRLRESLSQRGYALRAGATARGFDLDYHLRWESHDRDDELVAIMTERFFQPLDESRPPWEPHGLAGPERGVRRA